MEKIDIEQVKTFEPWDEKEQGSKDFTLDTLKLIAEKINEIIEYLQKVPQMDTSNYKPPVNGIPTGNYQYPTGQ
jgi:Asp-tRNA(Asn)/Glu-tRNA(Gln) amidotransferase C subunit